MHGRAASPFYLALFLGRIYGRLGKFGKTMHVQQSILDLTLSLAPMFMSLELGLLLA